MIKRLFDFVAAGTGLLLLAPLLLLVALWVRLDSPGPVLFRQERVGRHGQTFRIHKFRTMVTAPAGSGAPLTVGLDPRVTRCGQFLRRYKLDELPQLLDVIRGQMSLVGPRPEIPRYVAHYPEAVRDRVLSVRPGMTDLASLQFIDENELLATGADPERIYLETVLPRKLGLALEYVDRQSLLLDLRIILLTLLRIVWRDTVAAS
jgi:lipopolysaccharide/colanic/teichoic acid biosynthesis glycosyltransferase